MDYLGALGGIVGPVGIAGSVASSALGGALAGRKVSHAHANEAMKSAYSSVGYGIYIGAGVENCTVTGNVIHNLEQMQHQVEEHGLMGPSDQDLRGNRFHDLYVERLAEHGLTTTSYRRLAGVAAPPPPKRSPFEEQLDAFRRRFSKPAMIAIARELTLDELLNQDEKDDWDREFETRTGSLPPFSRLCALKDAY